jgi:selenocysteine-specific translation elongation factor
MNDIKIFAYDEEEFIKSIVKKHTESDISIFGRKDDSGNITLFMPSRYPDKISSLIDSMTLADVNIINAKKFDNFFGENVICSDLMEKTQGFFIADETTDTGRIERLIKDTNLKNYKIFKGSPMELLNVLDRTTQYCDENGKVEVIIDHFFKVKSVGTVVLGFVSSGVLKKHQTLYLNPAGIQVQVRSIQMNDVDYEEAKAGSRVGLALKNADLDTIDRGSTLTEKMVTPIKELEGEVKFHRAIPEELRKDGEVFIAGHFIYSRGILDGNHITMDKPILPWDDYILIKPNSKPRIIGKIKATKK